jgi:diacylglycerol kinase family enzyme
MVDKASRELKNILGPMAYIFSGARQLVDQQPFHATMQIDGKEYRLDASAITMANAAPATSVMAQGFGEVIPDDGLLRSDRCFSERPHEWAFCALKSCLVSNHEQ